MHEHKDDFDRIPYWEPDPRRPQWRDPFGYDDLVVIALLVFFTVYMAWQVARWWL